MKLQSRLVFTLLALATGVASGGERTADLVEKHPEHFRFLLTAVARTTGVHRQAVLDHLAFGSEGRSVIIRIALDFNAQDELLNKQAALVGPKSSTSSARLESLRVAHSKLLKLKATELVNGLSSADQELLSIILADWTNSTPKPGVLR